MKRFLVIIGVLFLLAAIGVGVFIATFDADRYRPWFTQELQRALQKPVTLERISLGWRGGIALQFKGLAIHEDAQAAREPLVQVESASALVALPPLLRKELRVSTVSLVSPQIHVSRDAQGTLNLTGLAAVAAPAAASNQDRQPHRVGGQPIAFAIEALRITDGSLHWSDAMTAPPTDLWIRALDVTVKNISPGKPLTVDARGALAGQRQNVRVSGEVTLPNPPQAGSVERLTVAIDDLPLEQVAPPTRPGEPQLQGKLTTHLQGQAASLDPATALRTVSGSGRIALAQPRVANINILRAVFERFSMLPGLVQSLEQRLPAEYREKFTATDTALSPVDVAFEVDRGLLRCDDLQVRSDTFGLNGSGTIGLDGTLNARAQLRIDPTLSAALISSVNELQGLTNAQGELELPVVIQGQAPRFAVLPDLNYVTSKLVVTKVQDLLGDFLHRALEHEAPSQPSAP